MKGWNPMVVINTKTWNKETHGLFDYESQNVLEQTLQTSMSVRIIRLNEGIKLIKDLGHKKAFPSEAKTIAYLFEHDGMFTLSKDNGEFNSHSHTIKDDFWLVVKSLKITPNDNGYLLRRNDVIKLGRGKFRIRELKVSLIHEQENNQILNPELYSQEYNKQCEDDIHYLKHHPIQEMEENVDINCRICLHSENNEDNLLVSPCNCSGSVQYVHIDCLKHWIKSKCVIKSTGVCTEYSWKSLKCELCHKIFPDIFVYKTKLIQLIDHERLHPNSILMESLPREGQSEKKMYLITVRPSNIIKIGRGHEVDVRINDISISRFHASLTQSDGNFYLHDNSSKFGTLALLKKNSVLSLDQQPSVQIGRTLLSFQIKAPKSHNIPIKPNLAGFIEAEKNLEMEEEPQPLIDAGKKIEFGFLLEPKDKGILTRSSIFQKPSPLRKSSHDFQGQGQIFNTNMFELKASKDSDQSIKNHHKETTMMENQGNPPGVNGRKQRRTITKEMEDLEISDEEKL